MFVVFWRCNKNIAKESTLKQNFWNFFLKIEIAFIKSLFCLSWSE